MRKAITLTLSIALLGVFAAVVVAAVGPSDGTSTLPTEPDRIGTTPDNTAIDISGPCDEAEHANDPRCTGVGVGDDDKSGPGNGGDLDEDDSSGPGRGGDDDFDDHGGDDFDDDSSGSGHGGGGSSGPG